MTKERTTPLRERMIEDMRIRGLGDKAQKAHIRAVKDFARFLVNGGAKSGHGAEQKSASLGVTGALANVLPI